MINPQSLLPIHNEIVVDLFAGGGGASLGIEQALGRAVDIAVNHDPQAISIHKANHPRARHFVSDVFDLDPVTVAAGRPVGLLWASPDCKHFSKAKGGKPVSKKIRSLAGVVLKWAKAPAPVKPRVICLENVEEFQSWGPLIKREIESINGSGQRQLHLAEFPCPVRKGETFKRWKRSLERLGYVVEHRELRACDYGAPTIRKRFFLVARCDGLPIVWPDQTHGASDSLPVRQNKLKPWRTAAECIDWSIPAPSIFERKKPLADATNRRIAKGIMRYVIDAAQPFIVNLTHQGSDRIENLNEPLRTVTGAQRGEKALVVPTLMQVDSGGIEGQAPCALDREKPLETATTIDHHSLVAASLVHMGHGEGKDGTKRFSHGVRDVGLPLNTVTAQGMPAALVTSHLLKLRGDNVGSATNGPLHTISAQGKHHAEVRTFLESYLGEGVDRAGLVTIDGQEYAIVTIGAQKYVIVDIGLRMLAPRELFRAQGFPEDYAINRGAAGEPITKTAQVRMCGNSVCPPLARAIVSSNYQEATRLDLAA